MRLGGELGLVHVRLHTGVARKVALDVRRRSLGLDTQVARQTEAAHAVDEAEVDDLGIAALLARHRFGRPAEHLRGGRTVHVDTLGKGPQQRGIAADVRHDSQLDLRVVGASDHAAGRRHEGLAHAAPFGCLDRDVLQVGVVAAQAPGHRNRLRVVRVHATGSRIRELAQLVGVGALQLGKAAVLQDFCRQRIVLGELLQHFFVRARCAARRLLDHGQTELGEEHVADLLRGAEVERLARKLVRLLLQRHDAFAELMALRRQDRRIDQHAVALHAIERLARRYLQVVDEAQLGIDLDARPKREVHVERLVAVFARVFRRLVDGHLTERNLVHAFAAQVLVANAAAAQMALRQAGQAVRFVGFEHIALQHGVVCIALHFDAVVGEDVPVVLDVLTQLLLRAVFEPRLELGEHLFAVELQRCVVVVVRDRDIGRLARFHAEAQADDLGAHFIERCRLGVDCDQLCRLDLGEPGVEGFPRRHRLVGEVGRL